MSVRTQNMCLHIKMGVNISGKMSICKSEYVSVCQVECQYIKENVCLDMCLYVRNNLNIWMDIKSKYRIHPEC